MLPPLALCCTVLYEYVSVCRDVIEMLEAENKDLENESGRESSD